MNEYKNYIASSQSDYEVEYITRAQYEASFFADMANMVNAQGGMKVRGENGIETVQLTVEEVRRRIEAGKGEQIVVLPNSAMVMLTHGYVTGKPHTNTPSSSSSNGTLMQ